MEDTAVGSLVLRLVAGVFFLIGLVFVPVTWRQWRHRQKTQAWPQAVASLREAAAVKHVRERPHKEQHTLSVSHACVLRYDYRVGGQTCTAESGLAARDAAHAAELAAAQIVGNQRTLWHDPLAPERYTFELASPAGALVWLLPGLAFAGFGALVLLMA